MQNIDVRFNATSNFTKVKGDLAALEAQAAALNATFQKNAYAQAPALVDSAAWKKSSDAISVASREYRNAASSSGLLNTQQIRATSEAEKYTKALQKQKVTLTDMIRHQGIMKEVYNDQLRTRRMTAQYWGTDTAGRHVTDISIPKNVPADLNTMKNSMGMFGANAASAGHQMINLGKNIQWSGRQLAVGFTYPMVLFGAAAGVMAYKTEEAFAKINKVYDVEAKNINNATGRAQELGQLRVDSMEMATNAAKKYGASLTQTLAVEQELAATGLRGKDLLKSTTEVARISALGDIDPAQTTQMVVSLKTAFKDTIKNGDDLTNTLNFMNATSNATSLSLQDIAEATPRAASGLAELGVSAKEMTVLLVSMRENGVDAAEAANALKSATTRILNPVKKAKDIYSQYGISLEALSKQSGGNLMTFLQLLGKEQQRIQGPTQKQTQFMRSQAIAALFGTYQFNRLNAALVNVADAYSGNSGVNNQTKKAAELMGATNGELAKMAENSRKAMMETPSGRFKQAWESFRIELAEVGNAFLEVGTKALTVFGAVAGFFNDLPDGVKKIALVAAGLLALVGPGIMLVGLFTNLLGQGIKLGGRILQLGTGFKILTKEEQAATLAAEAQNAAMLQQASSAATLAQEISVLTAAYASANAAAAKYLGGAEAAAIRSGQVTKANTSDLKKGYVPTQQETAMMATISDRDSGGKFKSKQLHLEQARNKLAYEYMAVNNQVARDATTQQQRTAAIARQTAKIKDNMHGGAIAGGVMSAALATTMISGNKTADSIAKWAMVGTIAVPAFQMIDKIGKSILATTRATAAAQAASAGISGAQQAAQLGRLGAGTRMLTVGRAAVGGLAAAVGPVGAIALGVTAVTAGVMMWQNHLKAVREEQTRVHNSVNDLTKAWAQNAGLVAKKYNEIKVAAASAGNATRQDNLYDSYNKGEMKQKVKDFKSFGSEDQANFVDEHFLELIVKYGQTAQQAGDNIRALYAVAGRGADEANQRVQDLIYNYGKLGKQGIANSLFQNQIDIFKNKEAGTAEAKRAAKDVADTFQNAFATANPLQAQKLWDDFVAAADSGWKKSYDDLITTYSGLPQAFAQLGIDSADELRNAVSQAGGVEEFMTNPAFAQIRSGSNYGSVLNMLRDAANQSKNFYGAISASSTDLGKSLANSKNSFVDFANVWAVQSKLLTLDEQIKAVRMLKLELAGLGSEGLTTGGILNQGPLGSALTGGLNAAKDSAAAAKVNIMNMNRGLATGANAADAIKIFMEGITPEAWAASQAVKNLAGAVQGVPSSKSITLRVNKQEFGSVLKSAMSSVQDQMASSAQSNFDKRWDATIRGAEEANRKAEDGQKARHERQKQRIQDAIDAEKKANDIRQRLFEAEKTRAERLAQMQNNQIDFDQAVNEGRLDDAAKIQNNATADNVKNEMEDEQKRAEIASQARIDALEKRSARLEKIQERREAGMQRAHEREINNLNAARDAEKASLDQRLELFKAYTAKNQADLERWMKKAGVSYQTFGNNILANGKPWATSFKQSLNDALRIAGMEAANDKMWSNIGAGMADDLLKGLGFPTIQAFNRFVRTGNLPKGLKPEEARHRGGVVGGSGSSRVGYSGSMGGNERVILAENGEHVTNKKMSQKYSRELEAINNGTFHGNDKGIMGGQATGNGGGRGAGFAPLYGLISGAAAAMFGVGLKSAFSNYVSKRSLVASPAAGVGSLLNAIGVGGNFVSGSGGRHAPTTPGPHGGLHDQASGYPGIDFARPVGTPIYAVGDGKITRSYDIKGYEPRRAGYGKPQDGFKSYGRVVYLSTGGSEVLYAHLSKRSVAAGQQVKGGSILGYTGDTGNSTGPHLHFGSKGKSPTAWLRKGGTVKWDNTPATLHRGETVLTDSLTKKFKDNVASGGGNSYDVTIDLRGAYIKEDVDIKKAVNEAIDERNKKTGIRRVVN